MSLADVCRRAASPSCAASAAAADGRFGACLDREHVRLLMFVTPPLGFSELAAPASRPLLQARLDRSTVVQLTRE